MTLDRAIAILKTFVDYYDPNIFLGDCPNCWYLVSLKDQVEAVKTVLNVVQNNNAI